MQYQIYFPLHYDAHIYGFMHAACRPKWLIQVTIEKAIQKPLAAFED